MDKPKGTFKCMACGTIYDGSELEWDHCRGIMGSWTCGNILCSASVLRISDKPKNEYLRSLE